MPRYLKLPNCEAMNPLLLLQLHFYRDQLLPRTSTDSPCWGKPQLVSCHLIASWELRLGETPFTQHDTSTRTAFLASTVWRTRPNNKIITILTRKVPGKKDMFAPVLSGVPGQTTRCPCGQRNIYGQRSWPYISLLWVRRL